jgi:hypothetical protein
MVSADNSLLHLGKKFGKFCLKLPVVNSDITLIFKSRSGLACGGMEKANDLRGSGSLFVTGQGWSVMKRWLLLAAVAVLGLANTGCFLNQYSSDPNIRMDQLLNQSEDLRQIQGEWSRFWMNDQPSHLTPIRVHGGIGP